MIKVDIVNVTEDNIELFSKVLIESARWLESIGESMWKVQDLTVEELLKKYKISEMKLCY